MQQSGGLLLAAGWTAATPLFLPVGQKCKRVPFAVPKIQIPIRVSGFLLCKGGLEQFNATVRWTVGRLRLDGADSFIRIHSRMRMQTNPSH